MEIKVSADEVDVPSRGSYRDQCLQALHARLSEIEKRLAEPAALKDGDRAEVRRFFGSGSSVIGIVTPATNPICCYLCDAEGRLRGPFLRSRLTPAPRFAKGEKVVCVSGVATSNELRLGDLATVTEDFTGSDFGLVNVEIDPRVVRRDMSASFCAYHFRLAAPADLAAFEASLRPPALSNETHAGRRVQNKCGTVGMIVDTSTARHLHKGYGVGSLSQVWYISDSGVCYNSAPDLLALLD